MHELQPCFVAIDGQPPVGPFVTLDAARREAAARARERNRGGVIVDGDTQQCVERFAPPTGPFHSVAFQRA